MNTLTIRALGFAVAMLVSSASMAQIQFTDVTASSRIQYKGESWGASWGDVNADGLPDLFVNNHRSRPGLYLNRTNGLFEDRQVEIDIWRQYPFRDQHGGAWGDFDNDGDQDLLIAMGSKDPTQFLINAGGTLSEHIQDYTIDQTPRWQGRSLMWFDFSHDGRLDFAIPTSGGVFQLFAQSGSGFIKQNSVAGNKCTDNPYGQLADLNYDGRPEWICAATASFPQRIYDTTTLPFVDRSELIPFTTNTVDSVFGDFNGDLRDDLFLVTGKVRVSGAELVAPNKLEAHIITDLNAERGFTFRSSGDVTFRVYWSARNVSNVRIGAAGRNPTAPPPKQPFTFTLSPGDPTVVGIQPHTTTTTAIFVGYDPASETWTFTSVSGSGSGGGEGVWSYSYVYVDSTAPISAVTSVNLAFSDRPSAPVYFASTSGAGLVNRTAAAQLNSPVSCVSTAAADFDNDMDLDLYLVCRNAVSNAADILYENRGDGVFTRVPNAGGATGPLGAGAGLGDSVVLADYDLDGFVDIFQTNGLGMFPENPNSAGGPVKLYRNVGNSNNWVQLDLIGSASNRDGIGAQVIASSGSTTQRRMQNGGYHRWSQNSQRIHFGLADSETVDLQILWPSGVVDSFAAVAVNHIYRVTEGGGIAELPMPADPGPSSCNDPLYNKATDRGIFIWRNCIKGIWTMRVSPGGTTYTATGTLTSSVPLDTVTPFNLETNDVLNLGDPSQIPFSLRVNGSAHDGLDFKIPAGGTSCLNITGPAGLPVMVGGSRTALPVPLDLTTLQACEP